MISVIHRVMAPLARQVAGLMTRAVVHRVNDATPTQSVQLTALAGEMRMTKGAISKILRKLADKGAVEPYQLGSNRQKIFYRLTDAGQELFDAHRERHRGWEERELLFFRSLSEEELSGAIRFFNDYNTDLRARLGKE